METRMQNVKRFWNDESGSLLTSEYLILGALLTIGLVVGFTAARDAIVSELEDYAASICELDYGVSAPIETLTPAEPES